MRLFLLAFFKIGGGPGEILSETSWPGHLVYLQMLFSVIKTLWHNHPPGMEWPVLALLVSHGISFVANYLRKGEYGALTIRKLMNQPYKRIVLLHITIIAGRGANYDPRLTNTPALHSRSSQGGDGYLLPYQGACRKSS